MADPEDAVMTVREVSEYFKLAESTVYKLAQEGQLPGRKIGGAWRFSRKVLEQWLEKTATGLDQPSPDGKHPADSRDVATA